MTKLTRKEITAHIRNRIKAAGIKARVSMTPGSGVSIRIDVPKYGMTFSNDETLKIYHIAEVNKLTGAQSSDIKPMIELAKSHKWERREFYFEAPA